MWCWDSAIFVHIAILQQITAAIHRAQDLHTQKNIASQVQKLCTDQNAKLIEGYKQQIQKVNKMKIPENIKQIKINVIQKKIDSLSS